MFSASATHSFPHSSHRHRSSVSTPSTIATATAAPTSAPARNESFFMGREASD